MYTCIILYLLINIGQVFTYESPTHSTKHLLSLTEAILQLYKHPENNKTEDLTSAANEYLCELVKVRMGVRIQTPGCLQTLREVYLEGNPPFHLRNIPWGKLIEQYNWDHSPISAYEEVISDTRRMWGECLGELNRYKEPDEII